MKTIRATLVVEIPYSNDYMNYGKKLDAELRRVIDKTEFLNCLIVSGEHKDTTNGLPIIRDNDGLVEQTNN